MRTFPNQRSIGAVLLLAGLLAAGATTTSIAAFVRRSWSAGLNPADSRLVFAHLKDVGIGIRQAFDGGAVSVSGAIERFRQGKGPPDPLLSPVQGLKVQCNPDVNRWRPSGEIPSDPIIVVVGPLRSKYYGMTVSLKEVTLEDREKPGWAQ